MHPFFFIVSEGKFSRVALEKIVCVVRIGDRVQVHTDEEIYEPEVGMERFKELLPEEKFRWMSQRMAVAREIIDGSRT